MRNQIARNIDVMLEDNHNNERLHSSLKRRDPDRSIFILLTPGIFRDNPQTRLYGWLMNEYLKEPGALGRDILHRKGMDWKNVINRMGWLTWEECKQILPDACGWMR